MKTAFINAKIYNTAAERFEDGALLTENGRITGFSGEADVTVDCKGAYMIPGLIDMHTHGRGGYEATDADAEGYIAMAKAYAAAGVADGIVQGKVTEDGTAFMGEEQITFNEAATVLNRVLDTGDVDLDVWYADREAVPSWAAQAVGNMEALNVLAVGSFGSQTMERAVTRADAAQMLAAVRTLLVGDTDRSLMGFLK